jgi:hypothetical protein
MKKALFQLQYEIEDRKAYSEQGAEQGAKLSADEIGNEAVRSILQQTSTLSQKELLRWLNANQERYPEMVAVPLTTSTPQATRVPQTSCSTISPLRRASLPTTTL